MGDERTIPRRPGGRPRMDREAPLYRVSTRLPVAAADRLIALADRRGTSVAATLRDLVLVRLR
jgi:hypothetical protein